MSTSRWFTLIALVVSAACARVTPEQRVIDDAAAALGGRERVLAVRSVFITGEGSQFNLGQDLRPDASGQTFSVTLTRRTDVGGGKSRTELIRTPNFPYFQGQAATRQEQGVDGDIGYNVAANGTATRIATPAARDRRADVYHYPLTIVQAALSRGAAVTNLREQGGLRVVDVALPNGLRFVLATDGTGLPARVESLSYHPNLGDVTLSTSFSDYQDASGVEVPTRLITKVDAFTTADLRIEKTVVDGDVGDLSAPAAAVSAPPVDGPPPPNVVVEEVSPGVWLLAGQSHHSVVAELSDHLVLIDAPQSEARTLAVIARARELRPGKPLTKVITTHHHFDHTAGIRAAIAEGLAVVTQSGNRAFFEDMATRRHSIVADILARSPRAATVETVDDELIVKDVARTMGLYHVAGNPHSDTMLMVHFPAERILVQVDAFSPGAPVNPYAANLLQEINRRAVRVDRIVPLHGAIAPFSDLVKVGGGAATRSPS